MAEVETQAPPPALQEVRSEDSDPVDATQAETDGEHEATDVVEAHFEPEPVESEDKPVENSHGVDTTEEAVPVEEDAPKENAKATTSPPASPAKKITAKSSISVKPSASGKTAGDPPTPLVKKVSATSWPRQCRLEHGICMLNAIRYPCRADVDHQLGHVWVWHRQAHTNRYQGHRCPRESSDKFCSYLSEEDY